MSITLAHRLSAASLRASRVEDPGAAQAAHDMA